MEISYIITISPVIPLNYLNILINSLNVQTTKNFDVIFYNQRKNKFDEIFAQLTVKPHFKYKIFSVKEKYFLGEYPIWNLYGFHQFLLNENLLGDYFMSLHMEEFLEPEYTEYVSKIIEENRVDILFGNLHRTAYYYKDVEKLSVLNDSQSFNNYLKNKFINQSVKWGLPTKPFFLSRKPQNILNNFKRCKLLKWKRSFSPTQNGFIRLNDYILEDVFFMSKNFAKKYGWYDTKMELYFEDIHINFSLNNILKKIIDFPVYFNMCKIYHLKHDKFYYQIEDEEFSQKMLEYATDNTVLIALKEAIKLYRTNNISVKSALTYSRKNSSKTGTSNFNHDFHNEILMKSLSQ